MASQEPNTGLNFGWAQGESGWHLQMDENLKSIGALLLLSVKSAVVSAPPSSPSAGDRYIIPTGGTGVWAGNDKKMARWDGTQWEFYAPRVGWEATALDNKQRYRFNGSNWVLASSELGKYASDAAAAASVPVGGQYINSTTGALTVRQS